MHADLDIVMTSPSVHVSVHLSDCLNISSNFTDDLVGHHFSFSAPLQYQNSNENPQGALNTRAGRISQSSRFITETVRGRPMVSIDHRKSHVADRSVSVPMTSSDLP